MRLVNNSDKTIIVGRKMDDIKKMKNKLGKNDPNLMTFDPSPLAKKEWNEYLKKYGNNVPDEIVKNSELYKENAKWIRGAMDGGFNVIDLGTVNGGGKGTFYEMEYNEIVKKHGNGGI